MGLHARAPRTDRRRNVGQPSAALGWSFANIAIARFGTIAIGIVLARLLGPDEFGTYAVAFVALMAILSFNELGVSLAIVRWRDDPAAIAPTVTAMSLAASLVLTVGAVVAAPTFATAMGDPGATNHVRLMSLCVLINGAVATPAALMQRYFRQDQRLVADQVNTWTGALVSIGLALAGVGAMSLVVGRLAGSLLSAVLFVRFSPLPYRVRWELAHVRPLIAFGLPLAGASIIVFLVGFLDQLVVGRLLGAAVLGYYVLGGNLASWPVTMFSQPTRNVAPALFARLQHDDDRLVGAFQQVLRPLLAISLPVCAVISAAAPQIVEFVYGPQWLPAAPVLRWLVVLAAFRIFFELAYDFLVVLQRSTAILLIQVVWVVALLPALYVGIRLHGGAGAGMALVLVSAMVSLPLYLGELRRSHVGGRSLIAASWRALVVAAGAGVASLGLARALPSTFVSLAACGLVMAAGSAILLWWSRADLSVFREEQS